MDIIFLNKCRAKIISDYGYHGEQIKCLHQLTNQEWQMNYALFSAYEDSDTGTIFECVMSIGSDELKIIPYYNPMKVMALIKEI